MPIEGTPTDRGYVVVSQTRDGYKVEVCKSVSPGGQAVNVYAEHVGVPEVVTQVRNGLTEGPQSRFSSEPLEVFVDADSGQLYVTDIADWSL